MDILELITLQNRFQPYLLPGHFSLIAPSDPERFKEFIELAQQTVNASDLHSTLSNQVEMRMLIVLLKPRPELRMYIVSMSEVPFLDYESLENYIHENAIDFPF